MPRLRLLLASALMVPILATAALLGATPSGAHETVPAEQRFSPFTGHLPGCGDPSVLGRIERRFASRESTYWESGLTILGFERVRHVAERPWGRQYVPRRFCTAVALMSDGRKRRVDYFVKEDLGIIGMTWGLNWCVHGLDRNFAYAPQCKMARP